MLKTSHVILVLGMLLYSGASSALQVGIGIGLPTLSIGISVPAYPDFEVVPGYPVYYAPRLDANYFFYDGMYWVFQDDNWYVSSWYDGPWALVDPYDVPVFILQIPVRYYHRPPVYFYGWRPDTPPHWGSHWGYDWERRRSGWDRWHGGSVRAPAPLPTYQRQYRGDRYPRRIEQQEELSSHNYHYQPSELVVRQHHEMERGQAAPMPAQRGTEGAPQERRPWQGPPRFNPPPPPAQPGAPERNPRLQGPARYNPPPPVQPGVPKQRNPWLQGTQRYSPPPPQASAPERNLRLQEDRNARRSAPMQPPPQGGTVVQDRGQMRQPGTVQHDRQWRGSQGNEQEQPGKDATRNRGGDRDHEHDRGRDRGD